MPSSFAVFARLHGLILPDEPIPDQKWHRCATENHPRKKNGSYRFCGSYGHIQDFAVHESPIMWRNVHDLPSKLDRDMLIRRAKTARKEIANANAQAAELAYKLLEQCEMKTHAYLIAKGFPEERVRVIDGQLSFEMRGKPQTQTFIPDVEILIPTYFDGALTGVQRIFKTEEGFEKRFLFGQRTNLCTHTIGNRTPAFYCEGYATGLSVRDALQGAGITGCVVVCFSAANLARSAQYGYVIADYDKQTRQAPEEGGMGIKCAKETLLSYWSSDVVGMDFNDYMVKYGKFRASQEIKMLAMRRKKA